MARRVSICAGVLAASCSSSSSPETIAVREAAAHATLPMQRVSLSDGDSELYTCQTTRPPCKNSSHPTLSYDAQRVAFDCDASDVVPDFPNAGHVAQIYLRDLASGSTTLVSAARDPNGAIVPPNGPCGYAELSGNGEFVAFSSAASNLAPGDDEKLSDVFLARVAPFELVSVVPSLDGESDSPSLSYDARFVAFTSTTTSFAAGELATRAGAAQSNVFVIDRVTNEIAWLSRTPSGTAPNGPSGAPSIDEAGVRVAFSSQASDLVANDVNLAVFDVFVADCTDGTLRCVSLRYDGGSTAAAVSRKPAISGNGRFVAFESNASDLLRPGEDQNEQSDVFVRDLQTNRIARISLTSDDHEARGPSGYAAISPDGRYVAFTSLARNLAPGDDSGAYFQLFVRDRDVSGDGEFDERGDVSTRRMSTTSDGTPANARSGGNADLSGDGRTAVFMSESDLLAPGDANGIGAGMPCSPTCVFGRDVFLVRFD